MEAWNVPNLGNEWQNLERKIMSCSALSEWNDEVFGDVKKKINQLSEKLKVVGCIAERKKILDEIGVLRQKEEIYWAQRAKTEFLKHGDSNSRWFHARAKMRRVANAITVLEEDGGKWFLKRERFKEWSHIFFSKLFETVVPSNMEDVLDCVESRVTNEKNELLCSLYVHMRCMTLSK